MYEVYLERAAEKDLRDLAATIFRRIVRAVKSLGEDPRPPGCHKIAGTKQDWRIRVGEYRVIYEVDDREKAVRVMRIRHRRDVYR